MQDLKRKLSHGVPHVVVVGGGYVGLPFAVTAARAHCDVTVYDNNTMKVDAINAGVSYVGDVKDEEVAELVSASVLRAVADPAEAFPADAVVICVPTPLQSGGDPDISFVVSAIEGVAPHLGSQPVLVSLESTVYPGCTREIVAEALWAVGRQKENTFVSFSPERVDPGNGKWTTKNTPKVVGGLTPESLEVALAFYRRIIDKVVPVSSTDAAEMVKLLENTFRWINIGLVNELAIQCHQLGVDVWEIVEAAKTKPFGFMSFTPGPGVGGHCLDGREYVFVRDGGGLRTVTLADLYAELGPTPPLPVDALSIRPATGVPTFSRISSMSRRMSTDPLLLLRTRDARQLRVTDKHPMLVVRDGAIKAVLADELVIKDQLVILRSWPDEEGAKEDRTPVLDVIELVGERAGRMNVSPRQGMWSEHDDVVRPACNANKVLAKDVYRTNSLPLRVYRYMEASGTAPFARDALDILTGRGNGWGRQPATIRVDAEFARLIGYYLAEGCLTEDDKSLRTRFCFGSHETDLIEDCCALLKKFGFRYSIYKDKQWAACNVKVSSKVLGVLLRDVLHCGVRSEDVQVPAALLGGPRKVREQLVAGLLRGDGGVYLTEGARPFSKNGKSYTTDSTHAYVNYFTCSPTLRQQAVLLLQSLGVVPQLTASRPGYMTASNVQIRQLAPLLSGEKRRRVEAYCARRKKPMPPKAYKDYGAFAAVELASIERVPPEVVYSMEVEGTHTFVTSYGIAVHNCISVDPDYLSWRLREGHHEARFIDLAGKVNRAMPAYVVQRLADELNVLKKPVCGQRVLVMGVAYKPDVDDTRESPALDIIRELGRRGAIVSYVDPHVVNLFHEGFQLESVDIPRDNTGAVPMDDYSQFDVVIIVTNHSAFDYLDLIASCPLVLDARGVSHDLKLTPGPACRLVRL